MPVPHSITLVLLACVVLTAMMAGRSVMREPPHQRLPALFWMAALGVLGGVTLVPLTALALWAWLDDPLLVLAGLAMNLLGIASTFGLKLATGERTRRAATMGEFALWIGVSVACWRLLAAVA